MIHLPGGLAAASDVQRFCRQQRWQFCFIGGVAVQRWGEPRLTQDVDVTILTGLGNEERFIDPLLDAFAPRRRDAREFALRHRVLLVRTGSGIDVDVAFGAMPFEERTVRRASAWVWTSDETLLTCSAEDLVVLKTFAGRDVDWGDVACADTPAREAQSDADPRGADATARAERRAGGDGPAGGKDRRRGSSAGREPVGD